MSDETPRLLTKSLFMKFLESPRILWDIVHQYDDPKPFPGLPPEDKWAAALMAEGDDVDREAGGLYKNAWDCQPPGTSMEEAVALSAAAFDAAISTGERVALVQPAAMPDKKLYARADIMRPDNAMSGGYEIIEVKAVNDPAERHTRDVAFQVHVMREQGIKVTAAHILHLNKDYVRHGKLDTRKNAMFTETTVTEDVEKFCLEIPDLIAEAQRVMEMTVPPVVDILDDSMLHMAKADCKHYAPEIMTPDSVLYLPSIRRKKALELAREIRTKKEANGDPDKSVRISDLGGIPLNHKETVFRQCVERNEMYCNKSVLTEMLNRIEFPVVFLDFETVLSSIPKYEGAKPNAQVPFQVCNIRMDSKDAEPEVIEHLADHTAADPRRGVLACIAEAVHGAKTVIAYNASFETTCLDNMEELADELGFGALPTEIKGMMEDVGKPFMGYHVYSYEQGSSGGLKHVSRALFAEDPYRDKEVKGGAQASSLFANMKAGKPVEGGVERVREGLRKYCLQDVQGMVDLVAACEVLAEIPEGERRFAKFAQLALKPLPPITYELDGTVLVGKSSGSKKKTLQKII